MNSIVDEIEKESQVEPIPSLEQNHQQVVAAENIQDQINAHENQSKNFLQFGIISNINWFTFTVNFLNMAKQIANDKGYPNEAIPILFALVESLNGKQDEVLKYLDEGKKAVADKVWSFQEKFHVNDLCKIENNSR